MTIPKTYTLRQLRKLGKRWLFVDLFLDCLAEQERDEAKGTKVPEMKIDLGKAFVPTEDMDKKIKSYLLYPITVLESERDNYPRHSKSLADQLTKAIDILTEEKYKRVKEEFNIAAKKIAEDELKKKKKHHYFDQHELVKKIK